MFCVVAPLLQRKVVVKSNTELVLFCVTVMLIEPSLAPKKLSETAVPLTIRQNSLQSKLITSGTVTEATCLQPSASVTFIEYSPAPKPVKVAGLDTEIFDTPIPFIVVEYGAVPPSFVTVN